MRDGIQQEILDMIARGRSVIETTEHVCRHAERLVPGVLCSVVRIDHAGMMHPLAGKNIPPVYSSALDGIPIGPDVGSCGTAAYFRKPVSVKNLATDPLWSGFKELVDLLRETAGVKACWSSPIIQSDGRVAGVFGFYYRENRGPTDEERKIVAECVDLCALALERDEVKAENRRLAYFDALTGLGNRASFMKTLEDLAENASEAFAILLMDIDHLCRFNDSLGHIAGDRLITDIGETIAKVTAPAKVFRMDADEFGIIVAERALELPRLGKRILDAVQELSTNGSYPTFDLSVSCGGALSDQPIRSDLPTLLQRANLALHHAKQTAPGSFVLYHEGLSSSIAREFRVLQMVTSALAEDRIEAHYQPIVDLDTREIISLEALCRVRTPSGRFIPARHFAQALQSHTMGNLITDRMLMQVARDIRFWLDRDMPFHHVGINLSMADFRKESLQQRIAEAFCCYGIPLEHIILEVTESIYMDEKDRHIASDIEELRADGLLVALDDFGTGYASLTHLLNFPVDIIKIDKSFVDRLSDGAVIIKAILDIADGLGMQTVAEGVETIEQAKELQRLGCSVGQGYLFGRPAGRDKTTELLQIRAERQKAS